MLLVYLSRKFKVMDYNEMLIALVDKAQSLYEWLVKMFGHIVDWFERLKNLIIDLVLFLRDKFSSQDEIDAFLKNYLENEHFFI